MLRGGSPLSLDAKGRVAIPGRYRGQLAERCGGRLVLTVNTAGERCLWLYPMDEWERVERKVDELPSFQRAHQKLKRFFIGHAREVDMDKSGRLLLPAPLKEFARIDKEVFLVGQGNKFEIWNAELWNTQREQWLAEELDTGNLSVEMEQLTL
ncbi:MAG: division/cell wall cluster transcriptional repressor MraZ [Gammaproteobacteria bacterium]|nr:division/cell wall cluster transcriptional repressor MraZ [Gammaproteobacteria bacterium]CAJ2376882.1 MAG: DNA-binding transcriptional repressor MraZ [Arenicellales bacterium IbO2]MDA7961666.1 division/cell wall cluster transcriptional repressor MraZ [Gammaproteobacteria bacterium]MDA7967333.1 division/cell wall cluster transcriptional repressor MraZ [Gammaproteobacteria bacterium]MDA7969847.1 division/cell wall cluster transcriptional repressor MraZ [Gammaproteobacteria bacterium]